MTECFPALDRNAQEDVHHLGIIAASRPAPNFFVCLFEGESRTIGTVRRHRVQAVCNSKYSRPNRNVRRFQASGITAAIATLMVCQDDFRGICKERYAFD